MISILIFIVILMMLFYSFPIVSVIGDSMFPTYKDGDTVFATRIFTPGLLRAGDVVVIKLPGFDRRAFKRIIHIDKESVWVEGDNKAFSFDSRSVGSVPVKNIVAKVLFPNRQFKII